MLFLSGCASPNMGNWQGHFAGTAAGEVSYSVNRRGNQVKGRINGETKEGYPFRAEFRGHIDGENINALFTGTTRENFSFSGKFHGRIGGGTSNGEWEAEFKRYGGKLHGQWEARQVP
jgi:hypothetical protein